jgi:2-hydroxychromene-2-carboxylate isomerase
MGDVIDLHERRRARLAGAPRAVAFHFDLACPFAYLAAESVDRLLPGVAWRPTAPELPRPGARGERRARALRRAQALRLPLQWPERLEDQDPAGAMRAAAWAAAQGRGGAFALAAGRLVFGGGFELADPELVTEAAAAAGLPPGAALRAAADDRWDGSLRREARRLRALGATALPAVRVGPRVFCGEEPVAAALAASGAEARPAGRGRPGRITPLAG